MVSEIELHVHYLCPYAQRALYVKAFKGIECKLIEEDLSMKSESLYSINPLGKVPAVRVSEDGVNYNLYESIEVCEWLDSFPGPSLYPRLGSGPDPLCKALIDDKIRIDISDFVSAFVPFWWKIPTEQDKIKAQTCFEKINQQVQNGNFIMNNEIGNILTMADVMLYPFIERMWALKESYLQEMTTGINPSNMWKWYNNMSQFSWIQAYQAGDNRLRNLIGLIKRDQYPGLALPVTIYD